MCQIFGIGVRTVPNLERYRHKCQIKIMIFYSTFLCPLTSLFDFFLSLLTICLSPVFFLCFIPLQIRFPAFPSTSTSTSNVFLSLCTSNQTQINVFLLSLSSGRDMDWVVIDWLVFGGLMVEFWVWVVELVVISVLGGSGGFGFLLVLEVGCGVNGSDQTQIRTILSSEVTSSSTVVAPDLAALFSTTRCQPLSIKLWVWDLGWCCGFEIWDGADGFEIFGCGQWCGAVDLVAILVKYYFNVWIYFFNV